MTEHATIFGSLESFEKGVLEIIDDDPKRYTYSNMFDVASRSEPYEKVAVAKNMEYVLEVLRAEGTSGWRTAAHDEFALVMDGEVEYDREARRSVDRSRGQGRIRRVAR